MILGIGPAIGVAWVALLAVAGGRSAHVDARFGLALGAYAVAVGAAIGAFAGAAARLRARLRKDRPHDGVRLIGERFGIVVVTHLALVLRSMAEAPQLYEATWYGRGALPRTVQVLATDVLGPTGVLLLAVAAVLAYLFGSPQHWDRWREETRRSAAWARERVRSLAPAAATTAAVMLLGLGACSARPRGAPDKPNVLLFIVSSLRADRVDGRVAPHLAALAARGARFDAAYATSGSTLPAVINVLTGRDPARHGVHSSLARWEERARDFDAAPARFAARGYSTTAIGDAAGDVFRSVDLGFARVLAPSSDARDAVRRRALARQGALLPFVDTRLGRGLFPAMRGLDEASDPDQLAGDAIGALDRDGDRPFFLTVLLSTAHAPYAARWPWYRRFTGSAYRGRFKYDAPVSREAEKVDAEDVAQERALYDGAVAAVDAAVGRVLSALERRRLGDRTVVVVTADHGEGLHESERGRGHGEHLFGDERTHVPLIVLDPRAGPARSGAVVRDVDVAPTLYALAGVDAPEDLDGRALDAAVRGGAIAPRPAFAETTPWRGGAIAVPEALRFPTPPLEAATEIDDAHGGERVMDPQAEAAAAIARHRMVRDERWKLVFAPTRDGGKTLLFDTEKDPAELRDVAAEHPDEAARLEALLWKWMLADPRMTRQGALLVPRDRKGAR